MPLYTESIPVRRDIAPDEISAGFGEETGNIIGNWWNQSLSPTLYDAAKRGLTEIGDETADYVNRQSPLGPILPGGMVGKDVAATRARDAGVSVDVPDDGIGTNALDLLIERRKDQQATQDMLARPHSTAASIAGNIGGFLSNVVDPSNVLLSFVPIVGEERYASLLAGANGALGRAAVRTGIGAAEGGAGATAAEPLRYAAANYLQDDYTLADSLSNVLLGGVFGAGLHVAGGAFRDALYPGWYKRAAGGEAAASPLMADNPDAGNIELQAATGKLSDEELRQAGKTVQVQQWIRQIGDEAPAVPDSFRAASLETKALRDLAPQLKSELETELAGRAEPGIVPETQQTLAGLQHDLDQTQNSFREIAKDFQGQGYSRKEAESQARKKIAANAADIQARIDEAQGVVEGNAKGTQAAQDIAKIDQGIVPDRFKDRVATHAGSLDLTSKVADYYNLPMHGSAAHLVANATPETRTAAFRTFALQMLGGHVPDVDPIIKADPNVQRILAASGRDPNIANPLETAQRVLASDRLGAVTPKAENLASDDVNTAQKLLDSEVQRLTDKLATRADSALTGEALKSFDDAIAKADTSAAAYRAAAFCGGAR